MPNSRKIMCATQVIRRMNLKLKPVIYVLGFAVKKLNILLRKQRCFSWKKLFFFYMILQLNRHVISSFVCPRVRRQLNRVIDRKQF